jgi:2-polyprenyl-6-hydroxyphenyl methylase/3-demethylubiquinone-9 3-methyltransferase
LLEAAQVPADNRLYDAAGDIWWDETSPLSALRTAVNPGRVGYLRQVLDAIDLSPAALRALDVGCGGGLMAEEVAALGFRVTGIDPSGPSISTARRHAAGSGAAVQYLQGAAESLPFAEASFDLVCCCDVLEHVADVDRCLSEAARVLKPGGVYFFDTINRTWLSRLVMISLLQEWPATRLLPRDLHDHAQFIRPRELVAMMEGHGLRWQELVGLGPWANPIALIRLRRRLRKGEITPGELGRRTPFVRRRSKSVLYAGHAVRSDGAVGKKWPGKKWPDKTPQ